MVKANSAQIPSLRATIASPGDLHLLPKFSAVTLATDCFYGQAPQPLMTASRSAAFTAPS